MKRNQKAFKSIIASFKALRDSGALERGTFEDLVRAYKRARRARTPQDVVAAVDDLARGILEAAVRQHSEVS